MLRNSRSPLAQVPVCPGGTSNIGEEAVASTGTPVSDYQKGGGGTEEKGKCFGSSYEGSSGAPRILRR